jgi:transposase
MGNKKHSFDFKLSCVKQMADFYRSADSISKEYGLTCSMVKRWYRVYEQAGSEGLRTRKGKLTLSPSFKLEVLNAIRLERLSLNEAVLRFGLSTEALIVDWRKKLDKYGLAGLEPRPKGRPPMAKKEIPIKRKPRKSDTPLTREEELMRENEHLRAENALLKKLQALVQAENKRKP